MSDNKHLLETTDVSEVFGGLKAVSDFNIYIDKGELIGLIGPNGAGKTTAFNLITGVYQPTTGEIIFDGKSVVGLKPYEITQRGVARTFQNIRLFSELSVLDNVKIAYHCHVKYGLIETVLRIGRYFGEEKSIEDDALNLLKIFKLDQHAHEVAKAYRWYWQNPAATSIHKARATFSGARPMPRAVSPSVAYALATMPCMPMPPKVM